MGHIAFSMLLGTILDTMSWGSYQTKSCISGVCSQINKLSLIQSYVPAPLSEAASESSPTGTALHLPVDVG